MGSVVISHLIGTVSLLVLFSIVAANFTINYSLLQLEVLAYNLQDIAEHVSAEITDLVSLCYLSSGDQLIFKELDVPENVSMEPYNLSIVCSQNLLKVIALPTHKPSFYGEALLPWSAEGNIGFYDGTNPGIPENSRVNLQILPVESYRKNLIIWCLKKGDRITFGLGYLREG